MTSGRHGRRHWLAAMARSALVRSTEFWTVDHTAVVMFNAASGSSWFYKGPPTTQNANRTASHYEEEKKTQTHISYTNEIEWNTSIARHSRWHQIKIDSNRNNIIREIAENEFQWEYGGNWHVARMNEIDDENKLRHRCTEWTEMECLCCSIAHD